MAHKCFKSSHKDYKKESNKLKIIKINNPMNSFQSLNHNKKNLYPNLLNNICHLNKYKESFSWCLWMLLIKLSKNKDAHITR